METPPAPTRAYNLYGKPDKVVVIILLTLISGIFNLFTALVVTGAVVLGTLGVGLICCAPLTLLPGVLGVFEALYAFQLMAYPAKAVQPNPAIAALEICCIAYGNVLALVAGVVALILYNDPQVRDYFTQINAAASR